MQRRNLSMALRSCLNGSPVMTAWSCWEKALHWRSHSGLDCSLLAINKESGKRYLPQVLPVVQLLS
ncbi:uncharacterized protein BXIN_2827 [Babesia sp. Xinjiang]|uniref:uncharacterized protein n=1 Tax=Babesia sp. Xinjiang TaxID=462227 RepID=UPI000A24701C|nr:uncharacterized protein BXIN_2827 [Babesia sp. Xinjiang]ORM40632.1 hypothetical protein BXIN_2827 [Babesia sp. Xinjiang]